MALTEQLAILIDAHAGGAIAEFKKVGGAARGLEGQVAGSTKAMGGLGKMGAAAGGMLKANLAAGAAAAGAAIVGFGVSAVKSVQDLDAAILKFQRASGATTEEASALIAAFDDMAIPAETGSKAIFQLGKRLETSGKTLAGFGIVAVKNKQGNTDLSATLLSVADAYQRTTDPAKRAALVTAAFGKSGQDMIPILEKGSAGIRAFYADAAATGQIRTPEQVAQTDKLRVAVDGLSDAGKEFSIMAGTVLVPVLTDMVNVATSGIGAIKDLAGALAEAGNTEIAGVSVKGILDKITDVTIPGKLVIGTLMDMAREGENTGGAFTELTGIFGEFAGRVTALNGPLEEADEDLDKLSKALFTTADADRALVDSHRDVKDAQADLNKLLKEGAVDAEKVADAQRSVASANRSVGSAQRDQVKAQDEYNQALAAAQFLGTDDANDLLAEAGDNLADANDSLADATDRAKAAGEDLQAAQAGDPEFQSKLADARQKVADATLDMSEKSLASVNAHKAETTALSTHSDEVKRLYDLNAGLIAQNPDLLRALAPVQTALQGALNAAPSGLGSPAPGISADQTQQDLFNAGAVIPGNADWMASAPTTTTSSIVNHNTVTINPSPAADARLIAKEVMWNLQ